MKILIGHAGNKRIGFDLDTLIPTRLLIQANSGAGKSYLLRKLMEELFGHVQVIAIDPEGEFATLREKFGYVLVGKGGETPADVRSAATVAEKLLELRASAVCDLYEMPARDRHAWVRTFLDALINAPKKLWHPVVIIIDEAHLFCPEKGAGESEASDAMIDLATRGRKRGFCAVFATQRLGKLRKDAAAELQNVLVGGTFLDVDVKRAAETLGIPPGKELRDFAAHMKVIAPGTFIALGRAISKERIELKVDEVQTSHPKPGSAKHAAEPPPPPEKVRELLPSLADLPKVAEEKARTVADFKKQIRELTQQLATAKRAGAQAPPPAVKSVEPAAVKALQKRYTGLKACMEDAMKIIAQVTAKGFEDLAIKPEELKAAFDQVAVQIGKLAEKKLQQRTAEVESLKKQVTAIQRRLSALIPGEEEEIKVDVAVQANKPFTVTPPATPIRRESAVNLRVDGISRSQLAILSALAQFEAIGRMQMRKETLAALAGASATSSTFGNNLSALRVGGHISYPAAGYAALTESGRAIAPQVDPPRDGHDMLERCKNLVSGSQAAILEGLAKLWPNVSPKSDLAELIGASATSSTYGNNLSALRTAGMIDYPAPGMVKLSPWVLLEDAA